MNWKDFGNAAGGLGGLAGGIAGLFGGGKKNNPYSGGGKYFDQIQDIIKQYSDPYVNAGRGAMGGTQGVYDQMRDDPGGYYNKLGAGYKESPGYQFKLKNALQAGSNAQAAGGMAGSPQHEQQNMGIANDIASQDFNEYMNQIMGINKGGLEGEENTINRGFNAGQNATNNLGTNLGQKNAWNAGQKNWNNENRNSSWGQIGKGIGQIVPWLFS